MDCFRTTLILGCLVSLGTFCQAQYDTPNDWCGGWFKSQPGSIRFHFSSPEAPMINQACVWTINPASPSGHSAYSVSISRTPGLNCSASEKVTVTYFELGSNTITSSFTWACATPVTRPATPGTVIVVVFTSPSLNNGTGFSLDFTSGGTMVPSRLRNVNYNWGKASSYPNYYASGFFRNEIVTHAFARANNTNSQYNMNLSFTRLRFDCQDPNPTDLDICVTSTPANLHSKMLIFEINESGALALLKLITGEGGLTDQVQGTIFSGKNGVFLLIWGGDYNYAGGSMQLDYDTGV